VTGSGEPLLLLHGGLGSSGSKSWDQTVDAPQR
jgi:hypothetical protein